MVVAQGSCILRVSAGADVSQRRATEAFCNGVPQWKAQCGCGASFVLIEGLRGGSGRVLLFMLGSSPVHILRRDS